MKEAQRAEDYERLAGYAHAIRGSAANLMGTELSTAARALEELCRAGDHRSIPPAVARLEAELLDFRARREAELERTVQATA